jgi:heme-degrading monooxygenase HmoA
MVARVTHYQIRAGKIEDFVATVESLTAALDKLTGFRSLVVLRGEDPTSHLSQNDIDGENPCGC